MSGDLPLQSRQKKQNQLPVAVHGSRMPVLKLPIMSGLSLLLIIILFQEVYLWVLCSESNIYTIQCRIEGTSKGLSVIGLLSTVQTGNDTKGNFPLAECNEISGKCFSHTPLGAWV